MHDIYDNDFDKAFDEAVDAIEKKEHRLIWADKLKRHYAWWGNDGAEYRERKADFDVIVDLQPTVEVMTKGKFAALMGLHITSPAYDPCAPLDADFVKTVKELYDIPAIDMDSITKAHADIGYEQGYRDGYATAKPVSARWKGAGMGDYMCSRCGEFVGKQYTYCPYCGLPMYKDWCEE